MAKRLYEEARNSEPNNKKAFVLSDSDSTPGAPLWNFKTPLWWAVIWCGFDSVMRGLLVVKDGSVYWNRPLTAPESRTIFDLFTLIVRKNLTGRRVTFI